MSRARNIKPGFFKNEKLAELPFEDRILFQGLWCEADREGRLEDRPKRIKAEVFPYDDVDVDAALNRLQQAGFVVRYESAGKRCIEVVNFAKHQNPHKKEAASVLPERFHEVPGIVPESPGHAQTYTGTSPADSLIPDSLIPEVKQEHVQPAAARPPANSRFGEFWAAYPNKKGKQDAEKAWRKRGLDAHCDALIAHVQRMTAADADWLRGYVPMGSTYLNQARWEDVPKLPYATASPQPSHTRTAAETLLNGTSHAQRAMDQRCDPPRFSQAAEPALARLPGR